MYSASLQNNRNFIISQLGEDYIDAGNYEMRYQCPFCMDQGLRYDDYKFYITYKSKKKPNGHWTKAGTYWCHRCESTGIIQMDSLLTQGSNSDASNYLEAYMKALSGNESDSEEESDYYLIPKNIPMPGTLAWDYLISRGITPADMSFYNIRIPGLHDESKFKGRIIIPNKVISNIWTDLYVARTFIDDPVRYKNPSSSKAHDIVFNLHRIPDNPERIILNEGAINSIIAGTDSIATYGKHVSDIQLNQILQKHPKRLYVSLDTDAENIAEELCRRIKSLSDTKLYLLELPQVWSESDKKYKGLDASDLGRDRYLGYVDSAREYTSSSIFTIEKYMTSIVDGAR